MTKLPQVKPSEVVKALERLGFEHARTVGSHARLIHANGQKVTISLHRGSIPKGTLKSILRQAQISKETLIKNL